MNNLEEPERDDRAKKMLAAVERLLASDDRILQVVGTQRARACSHEEAARYIVSYYATTSAAAGAIAAAPSIVPGWGTIGALGTVVAEMVYVLKTEVEMCLALCSLHGMDIGRKHDRQLAFLLATMWTHEVTTGRNILVDLGEVSWDAVVAYSPREISKALVRIMSMIAATAAARSIGKGVLRAIPVVSVGIGAGVNYTLTRRVGRKAIEGMRLHLRSAKPTSMS